MCLRGKKKGKNEETGREGWKEWKKISAVFCANDPMRDSTRRKHSERK